MSLPESPGEGILALRDRNEMGMIGHEAPGKDLHTKTLRFFPNKL